MLKLSEFYILLHIRKHQIIQNISSNHFRCILNSL